MCFALLRTGQFDEFWKTASILEVTKGHETRKE